MGDGWKGASLEVIQLADKPLKVSYAIAVRVFEGVVQVVNADVLISKIPFMNNGSNRTG